MATDLVPCTPGRPSYIEHDGGRVYIAVHDEFHRRIKADFKQRLKLVHPDMTPAFRVRHKGGTRAAHAMTRKGTAYPRREHVRAPYTCPHPNRGGRFRRIQTAYETWLQQELAWYARYGLTPP